MSILLSANPPHAGKLVDGIKSVEWRKRALPKGTAYIYETRKQGGCGLVIGKVEIVGSITFDPRRIPDVFVTGGGVDRAFILRYADGGAVFANICVNPKRYDIPRPLSDFRTDGCKSCPLRIYRADGSCKEFTGCEYEGDKIARPPQSFCYAERIEMEGKK